MAIQLAKLSRKPELLFVFIASFFGLLSAIIMPVLAVPDENQHFQVSYAMLSAEKRAPADLIFNEEMIHSATKNGGYKELFTHKTDAQYDGIAINTGSLVFDGKTRASIYDIMHLPQAIGVMIGKLIYPSIGVMVLMGRLATLAFYITALYFVIKKVRYGKWVFGFIASLPIIIQQAASLSYDPINALAIFAWVGFMLNLITQRVPITLRQFYVGILLAAFLLLSKSNNVLLLALLLAIPLKQLPPYITQLSTSKNWKTIKYTVIAAVALVVAAALYYMSMKLLAGQTFHPRRLLEALLNTFIWAKDGLIDVTTIGIIGQFSNFYYHLPIWAIIITFIVFILLILHEKIPEVSKRLAIISVLLFFGSILLVSIGMYYAWAMRPERLGAGADITDGIQGRYFTPLLILLFPAFAYLQQHIKIVTKNKLFIPVLGVITSVLLLSFYIAQTWHFFWQ